MHEFTPHRALLALHRLVDEALEPLIGELGLDRVTESIVTVDRGDLAQLAVGADPQSAVVGLAGAESPSLLIAEPSLCAAVLSRIWRAQRSGDAALTQVERAILQQLLSDVVQHWHGAWEREGVPCLPTLTMAATLSMVVTQVPDGPWYVARTVVLDGNEAVGVLLFCYPATLVPALVSARKAISWRARLDRGLSDLDRELLDERVQRLRSLVMPAAVTMKVEIPLRVINQLERGDVIALDAAVGQELQLSVLDRTVPAQLARHGGKLAIRVGGTEPLAQPTLDGSDQPGSDGYDDTALAQPIFHDSPQQQYQQVNP